MNGFAVVAGGLLDKSDNREWVADAKSALYRAQELLASYPYVLVHNAARMNSTISDGGAPVYKADFRGIAIDSLS